MLLITIDVSSELWEPVVTIGLRHPGDLAIRVIVLVPKAPVNKDDFMARWKDQVRRPRQVLSMQPITKAHRMSEAPNYHFRLHALGPNIGHDLASALLADGICHTLTRAL
jgi:hypothetical protein